MPQTDRLTGLVGNTGMKVPVRAATTAAITLSGLQTVDGVVLVADDRVLVKDQASGVDNGIYVADTGTWERARDCDNLHDIVQGSVVRVNNGTQAGFWYVTTASPITIGTTALAFGRASSTLAEVSAYIQTLLNDADAPTARQTLGVTDVLIIAASDETTNIIAGVDKVKWRMPYAFTVTEVRASLSVAQPSGAIFTVDINESGVSILSTKLTIDNGEKTSTTAATPAVVSDTALADDAEMSIDIDQAGAAGAQGLKVYLIGRKTA